VEVGISKLLVLKVTAFGFGIEVVADAAS